MTKKLSNNDGFFSPKRSNQKKEPSKVGKMLTGAALLIKHK